MMRNLNQLALPPGRNAGQKALPPAESGHQRCPFLAWLFTFFFVLSSGCLVLDDMSSWLYAQNKFTGIFGFFNPFLILPDYILSFSPGVPLLLFIPFPIVAALIYTLRR